MNQAEKELTSQAPSTGDVEAIRHLEREITAGKHWYLALLEAMGLWTSTAETRNDRNYQYLIAGEAFDWLLLAERLCQAVDSLLPAAEKEALLFHARPPLRLTAEEVTGLIGASKHRQYLNYFYGVTVEGALFLAVQEEILKEKLLPGSGDEEKVSDEAFERIYEKPKAALLKSFRQEKGYSQLKSATLTELKEFTYWLFKYRLQRSEKARVASDTRKALDFLERQRARLGFFGALAVED